MMRGKLKEVDDDEDEEDFESTSKPQRMANYRMLKADEAAMKLSSGLLYTNFIPIVRVGPLNAFEERYFIPNPVPDDTPNRSCIVDKRDDSRRYEVPRQTLDGQVHRPKLHRCADAGSIGWPKNFWLYCRQGVRGSFHHCWGHRYYADADNAFHDAGARVGRFETTAVFNYTSGPFKGDTNFWKLSGSHKEYRQIGGPFDALFVEWYERLWRAYKHATHPFGTKASIQEIWEAFCEAEIFKIKFDRVKLCRWGSHSDRVDEWGEFNFHCCGLQTTFMCIKGGLVKSLDDLPIYGEYPDVALEKPADAAAAKKDGKKKTVKESMAEVSKAFAKHGSALLFVCHVACNPMKWKVTFGCNKIMRPSRLANGRSLTLLSTRKGTLDWTSSMADGAHDQVLQATIDVLFGADANLSGFGFMMPDDPMAKDPSLAQDDVYLARKLSTFLFGMLEHTLLSAMHYSHSLPGLFAKLTRPWEAERTTAGLQELQNIFLLLENLDKLAIVDKDIQKLLSAMVWPHMTWIREVLAILNEGDFNMIPKWLQDEIIEWAQGFFTSRIVELFYQFLRRKERLSSSGRLCPWQQWLQVKDSKLLEDWDLPHIKPDSDDKSTGQPFSVKQGMFSGEAHKWSQGEDELTTITKKRTWPSPSPQAFQQAPVVLLSILTINNHAKLKMAWLSLLASRRTVLRREDNSMLAVIHVSAHGVIGMKAKVKAFKEPHFQIVFTGGWELHPIVELNDKYKIVDMSFDPPCKWANAKMITLTFCQKDIHDLLTWAANHGFDNMTVPFMTKLGHEIKHPLWAEAKTRPKGERLIMEALCTHILKDAATKERLQEIWDIRKNPVDNETESALFASAELLEEVIDEEDIPIIEKMLKKKIVKPVPEDPEGGALGIAAPLATAAAPGGAGHGSGGGSGSGGPVVPAVALHGNVAYTPAEIRMWLPDVAECSIAKDVTRFMRWQVYYPNPEPPVSASKVFSPGTGFTDTGALIFCLTWVWAQHLAATGQECPFNFRLLDVE
jgi:hypothetical protein